MRSWPPPLPPQQRCCRWRLLIFRSFGNRHSCWAVRRAWIHHLHLQRATSGDLNNQRVLPSIRWSSLPPRTAAACTGSGTPCSGSRGRIYGGGRTGHTPAHTRRVCLHGSCLFRRVSLVPHGRLARWSSLPSQRAP